MPGKNKNMNTEGLQISISAMPLLTLESLINPKNYRKFKYENNTAYTNTVARYSDINNRLPGFGSTWFQAQV
jgi:hypothetical protein